jgi:hypothetical protein
MNRGAMVVIALAMCGSLLAAESPSVRVPSRDLPAKSSNPKTAGKQKLREGGKIADARGRFELAGERIAFYPADGSETLPVLENLALERTMQIIQDSRGKQEWIVSGMITEFRGNNYLLLSKAVMRGAE